MDKIQLESRIWALEFDIKCLMCSKGNEKHIKVLQDSIAKLRIQLEKLNHE